MSILRALRQAMREGARTFGDEMAYIRRNPGSGTAFDAANVAKGRAVDEFDRHPADVPISEPGVVDIPLPNRATLTLDSGGRNPTSPVGVMWDWDDVGLRSGLEAGRSRRQVAETMNAALSEVGRRAVQRFPRLYQFGGLSAGHDRLYERMAKRLGPLYHYEPEDGIIPTPLAYASYAGQQGLRGGGLLALLNALTPADAAAPEFMDDQP